MENTEKGIVPKIDTEAVMAAVRKMAGGVAHDLNNMLTGILGFLALMKDDASDPQAVKCYRDEIEKNANAIKAFSDKLIVLSMQDDPLKISFDVNALIKEIAPGPWPGSGGTNHSVRFENDEKLLFDGDRTGVSYVLDSIIRKIAKGISSSGSISVTTGILAGEGADKEKISIRFGFLGVGMDKGDVLAMFEPSYTSCRENSLGYELVLVNEIVRSHGGVIRLFFKGEGAFDLEISFPA
jgi:signal transduction histidine kinase